MKKVYVVYSITGYMSEDDDPKVKIEAVFSDKRSAIYFLDDIEMHYIKERGCQCDSFVGDIYTIVHLDTADEVDSNEPDYINYYLEEMEVCNYEDICARRR